MLFRKRFRMCVHRLLEQILCRTIAPYRQPAAGIGRHKTGRKTDDCGAGTQTSGACFFLHLGHQLFRGLLNIFKYRIPKNRARFRMKPKGAAAQNFMYSKKVQIVSYGQILTAFRPHKTRRALNFQLMQFRLHRCCSCTYAKRIRKICLARNIR